MNKSIIVSGILVLGSMIVGCSDENLESKTTLRDSYISLLNSNTSNFNISNVKEDLKEYEFMEDSYYSVNGDNDEITSYVNVYSFTDDSSQIDLEVGSDNQINLNYSSSNSKNLLKSIMVNKSNNDNSNLVAINFNNIENRNKFISELQDLNVISDNYGLYAEIEKFISNNKNVSLDEIQSEFNIKFKPRNNNINEYTYGTKDNIKLCFDEKSMKFIAIEYEYNGNKLYYNLFNNPNSQEVQEDICILFDKNSTDINSILDGVEF